MKIGSPDHFRRMLVVTEDGLRTGRAVGKYPAKWGGCYHDDPSCWHLQDSHIYDNPTWRLLTRDECDLFQIGHCDDCLGA